MSQSEDILAASPNQTSAHFLLDYLRRRAEASDASPDGPEMLRYALGFDVYIKARSYKIINGVFFWLALLFSLAVVGLPLVAALEITWTSPLLGKLVKAAVSQTTVTAGAALFIYIYRHYKARQMSAENLLREIAFSRTPVDRLVASVIDEMARIDRGFAFKAPAEAKPGKDGE